MATARRYLGLLLNHRLYPFLASRMVRSGLGLLRAFEREDFLRRTGGGTMPSIPDDVAITDHRLLEIGQGAVVQSGARIISPPGVGTDSNTRIRLGESSTIGWRVQLGVDEGQTLSIGDYTTVQTNCIILGDVRIERYCLLSCNIFISSGDHHAKVIPWRLIRDQDNLVLSDESYRQLRSLPVVIEEDCWIGWGAVIKRGVYIGRGATSRVTTVPAPIIAPRPM